MLLVYSKKSVRNGLMREQYLVKVLWSTKENQCAMIHWHGREPILAGTEDLKARSDRVQLVTKIISLDHHRSVYFSNR
ncbi:hypothetical protein PM082_023397 [Marasmius tenuissimus]|nr:hypothetical protein PM082_023397 [Marasmius tenuissimus]